MPQKQIIVTIEIPEWAIYVVQDCDSEIWFYVNNPVKVSNYWSPRNEDEPAEAALPLFSDNAPNWENSKIDLRENDFEIVNGELVAIPKMKDLPEMLKEQA